MTINLSSLNIDDIQINNSYLRSSYTSESYPYIKGKRFESIYGDNRVVKMDSHLNKYYISHMKKQDYIGQEKKIIEIIEKLDNKKVFNVLKEDYLKEKLKISKGYYLKKRDNKKEYFTNLINLENYKDKLINKNKTNNGDIEFLGTLMDYLGCRPKKIIVKKNNKKIEYLSKFKSFSQRKKQIENATTKKPEKRKSLQYLLYSDNTNIFGRNNNYLNYYNTSSNKISVSKFNIDNNNNNNNNGLNNYNYIRKNTLELNEINNKNIFNQTNSTNFGLTNYNNFYNAKENIYNHDDDNNKNNSYKLNLQIEESSLQNSLTDEKINENNNNNNYKKINSLKNNSLSLNRNIYSRKSTKIENSSKEKKFIINSKIKNFEIKNKEKQISNQYINNKNNLSYQSSKKNKYLNTSSDDENYEELKMIDLKIMNEKLNKKHKKIMKKFLEKIKTEEKNIKENSNKLSNSIYLIKKLNQNNYAKNINHIKNQRNKTESNFHKKGYNTERNDNKKTKKMKMRNKEIKIGNYEFLGKSKYSLPKVNKLIFGSIENSKDPIEILQSNLQNEVIKQVEKKGYAKKLKLNGRDIIDKLRIKFQH